MRWLRIAQGELVREIKTTLRYPLDLLTGLIIMYAFFYGILTGAKSLAGGAVSGLGMETFPVRYCMWFMAIIAINSMSTDIESEARQGTLEQLFLHAPNLTGLLWLRGVIHVVLGSCTAVMLLIAIQLTTGHWLSLAPADVLPMLLAVLLTTLGLCGFGLFLGGLSLVYKRIGQLAAILQFVLFFLAFLDPAKLVEPLRSLLMHMPFVSGMHVLNLLQSADRSELPLALLSLLIDTAIYTALGTLAFSALKRKALREGLLSHY